MRMLTDTLKAATMLVIMVMTGGLVYQGLDSLYYYKQLQLVKTTPTEVLDKLNGCRVVYKKCTVEVVGRDPKLVDGIFNGVVIKNDSPYSF